MSKWHMFFYSLLVSFIWLGLLEIIQLLKMAFGTSISLSVFLLLFLSFGAQYDFIKHLQGQHKTSLKPTLHYKSSYIQVIFVRISLVKKEILTLRIWKRMVLITIRFHISHVAIHLYIWTKFVVGVASDYLAFSI